MMIYFSMKRTRRGAFRAHPRRVETPIQPWKSGKVVALATTRLSHPPTGSICLRPFLPPHFSPCRNLPSLTPAAWLRWPQPGRLFLFFLKPSFFLPHHSLHYLISERFPRRTGCCAFVCYCEAWFAILFCLPMHPADVISVVFALFPLSLMYVTRHISRVGGVLHSGISDSWFFRW